jgi:hypothetical protein
MNIHGSWSRSEPFTYEASLHWVGSLAADMFFTITHPLNEAAAQKLLQKAEALLPDGASLSEPDRQQVMNMSDQITEDWYKWVGKLRPGVS